MIKAIEFPNLNFASKEDLFTHLKKNEDKLISLKKAQVYKSHEKGQLSFVNCNKINNANKSLFEAKEGYIYPIISTTNYMDSHGDVHFKGSMNKTASEQQGKVVYALDHELKYNSILAWQKDVRMFISELDWSIVGKTYVGKTEGLVFEIAKDKITNKQVLSDIENKVSEFENSIRMIYYKIVLGMNSNSKEHTDNKKYYDAKVNEIANKELAEEVGYFWGVEELGIYKEGSLVVAGGSNDATAIYEKNIEADVITSTEPQVSTQQKQGLDYNYLINNFKL